MENGLSARAKRLLTMGILYTSGMLLASTFVNVYLIRLTSNVGLIILQNIFNFVAILSAFIMGAKLAKKISLVVFLRTGIILIVSYYTLILTLKQAAAQYLWILGFLNGLGVGFYFFSFNILAGKLLSEEEQPKFFSFQQSCSYIFGVLAPIISGYIIVKFTELTGYYVLFGSAVVLYLLAILISASIKDVKSELEYAILPVLKMSGNKYWTTLKYMNFTNGLREGIYGQIFTLFAYAIIADEQIIGNYGSMLSLIGVASSLLIASRIKVKTQKKYHLIASIIYCCVLWNLAIFSNKTAIFMAYMILGLILCWLGTIYQSMKYQLSTRSTKFGLNQSDYVIACEFPLSVGRILGMIIALSLKSFVGDIMVYRSLMFIIAILPLVDYFAIDKLIGWLKEEFEKTDNIK